MEKKTKIFLRNYDVEEKRFICTLNPNIVLYDGKLYCFDNLFIIKHRNVYKDFRKIVY